MATPAEIRAWAVQNGFPDLAGKRGRLPGPVFEAYSKANNGLPQLGGTGTPVKSAGPVAKNSATATKPCHSAIALPLGVEAKAIIAAQDGLCSGCPNKATEVVSLLDGQYPLSISEWTGLCGQCLCEWRKRVK